MGDLAFALIILGLIASCNVEKILDHKCKQPVKQEQERLYE